MGWFKYFLRIGTHKIDDILIEHGGLPYDLPLAVHLKFVWLDK